MEKQNLESEFVPYPLALRMKALGFDELCFGYYHIAPKHNKMVNYNLNISDAAKHDYTPYKNIVGIPWMAAPTWGQAFKWFREKYKLPSFIQSRYDKWQHKVCHRYSYGNNSSIFLGAGESVNYWETITDYETYEEAELACLEKLLDIVEAKLKAT